MDTILRLAGVLSVLGDQSKRDGQSNSWVRNMRTKCGAHVPSTGAQCKKDAIRGSRYCWHHKPKMPWVVVLAIGILTSLIIPRIWDVISPAKIMQEIAESTQPIPEIAESVGRIEGSIDNSNVSVQLIISVDRDVSDDRRRRRILGRRDTCTLVTFPLTEYRVLPG